MIPELAIEFDHPVRVYDGGDLISGSVVITHVVGKTSEFAQLIGIKLVGKAWTKWKESRRGRSSLRQYMVTISDEENYFEDASILFPKNMRASDYRLSPENVKEISTGRTEFPFVFNLPENVPSSFENKHGTTEYTLEVLYKRLGKRDKTLNVPIQVSGNCDLNLMPDWHQPASFVMEKKLWWWMGLIKVVCRISKRAYTRGDEIGFIMEVKNGTVCNLTNISASLTQIATFTAKGSTRSEPTKIAKMKLESVSPRQDKDMQGSLKIPQNIPPTTWNPAHIVQINYSLTVKVKASLFGQITQDAVLEGRIPLVIGTVGFTVRACEDTGEVVPVSLPFVVAPGKPLRRVTLDNSSTKPHGRNQQYEKPPDYDDIVSPEDNTTPSSAGTAKTFFSIA